MTKTIKFSDFMDKSYKNKGLSKREIEIFDTTFFFLAIGLIGFLILNLTTPMPLMPVVTDAFMQF